jgi:hypothetical protein
MHNRTLFILGFLSLVSGPVSSAIEGDKARAFVGQDLHLAGKDVISYQLSPIEHTLVFQNRFSMSIGANRFSSDSGVVWLESIGTESGSRLPRAGRVDYKAKVYLQGNVSVKKAEAAMTTELSQTVVEDGTAMVVRFNVSGEVFATAEKREVADPRGLELYQKALAAVVGKELVIEKPSPAVPTEKILPEERMLQFRYPINLAPAGEVEPKFESAEVNGVDVTTVIGRFYLWQKQDEKGGLLELQADSAVIFHSTRATRSATPHQLPGQGSPASQPQESNSIGSSIGAGQPRAEDILAKGAVSGIYLAGDVVMTEGPRTIRADVIYYDFERKRAVAINAVMRNFDVSQGIPIYVRAAQLRQLAENKFAAENITLTSSEFYLPQISLNASKVMITDTTGVDQQKGTVSKSSYDAQMEDVRLKMYDKTIFYWPFMRSNLQRPDIPLKGAHAGYDSKWGATLETKWYLARLLGLQEAEGTDSTVMLDYYSKHGVGSGIEIDYERENYFGKLLGYIIDDSGKDRLGRDESRRNLEPPQDLRGRFRWQHRQFLPYDWQLTTEIGYASDKNFVESYYRDEFYLDKEQETLVHLKRIEDNWGLAFLGKWRINDFDNQLEELPSAEFHWTGQSLLDDRLTYYSDSQLSRFRQRLASDNSSTVPQDFFTFWSTRSEIDMPITIGKMKLVPFAAETTAYEDGSGFRTDIDGTAAESKNDVFLGEGGIRASLQPYWKVFPDVKSQLWDLNQLRHIISPYFTAVSFAESDPVIEQRDVVNVGISQRLQTKRGVGAKERTVDWMRLDTDVTWVSDSGDTSAGPDRFIWNKPFIPLLNRYSPLVNGFSQAVPPQDRRSSNIFGPTRNSFCADYIWRLSDTFAILSDMNFDIQSGVVQQFNIGFSHLRWPNLSYYVGSRYLRRLDNGFGEEGSNAFTFAATYVIDPRYTVVLSQQFDFDYGANVRSDITLIRRYHRIYWGITYSADESLDNHAIVFSIWPEGVPELGIGPRRYMGLGGPANY